MTGTISRDFHIEMNLVKINDTLYGDYFFLLQGKDTCRKVIPGWQYDPLTGNMSENGVIVIRENQGEKGAVFTGRFQNGSTLTGTWESNDGGIKVPSRL